MSFLLSLFFAVLIASTMGLLSVPLRWVFLSSASTAGAFAELGSRYAWPPP